MDYSLFRDGTIAGFKLETKRRRHQSGLNVMAPKRIKNNDFATNLVPTERCLASWESQWSCYMFTWPLLSPPSIIGKKKGTGYSIAQVEKYVDTFFSFLFLLWRERETWDILLYFKKQSSERIGKRTYHCTAGQKIMFLSSCGSALNSLFS